MTATTLSAAESRIFDHPCYSENAHRTYARMHIPVAPGCNLQCNYCNRRFDCASENRPGVTSRLLTPEAAAEAVVQAARRLDHLRVVGVAGPGEPLANAARTFRALDLVRQACPEMRLCLSTNGLMLPDHVDRIIDLGIEHVTITINMIDPEVGARIYPWVVFQGRRYTGVEASRILGERQWEGLSALVARGVLCKVNSVMIPGVNDDHLIEVSAAVARQGATLHNVIPLMSKPEYETHYGLTGQREPTRWEVLALRQRCERSGGPAMPMMRHCHQCRADAIGLLHEDRRAEFQVETQPEEIIQ